MTNDGKIKGKGMDASFVYFISYSLSFNCLMQNSVQMWVHYARGVCMWRTAFVSRSSGLSLLHQLYSNKFRWMIEHVFLHYNNNTALTISYATCVCNVYGWPKRARKISTTKEKILFCELFSNPIGFDWVRFQYVHSIAVYRMSERTKNMNWSNITNWSKSNNPIRA